jgi:hypothetical protein
MSRATLSFLLLAVSIVLAAAALVTLVPHTSRTVSDLGYYTLCPFAPWSTLTLLFFGALAWFVRQHMNAQTAAPSARS